MDQLGLEGREVFVKGRRACLLALTTIHTRHALVRYEDGSEWFVHRNLIGGWCNRCSLDWPGTVCEVCGADLTRG